MFEKLLANDQLSYMFCLADVFKVKKW